MKIENDYPNLISLPMNIVEDKIIDKKDEEDKQEDDEYEYKI